jgi:AbrB family looped-hinge helix DNA binding protein
MMRGAWYEIVQVNVVHTLSRAYPQPEFICQSVNMANVVGDRFQITLDKRVREELGVKPGDLAVERVEGGRLVISFVPRPHRDSLLGLLRKPGSVPITDWAEVMEGARAARSDEILVSLAGAAAPARRRRR